MPEVSLRRGRGLGAERRAAGALTPSHSAPNRPRLASAPEPHRTVGPLSSEEPVLSRRSLATVPSTAIVVVFASCSADPLRVNDPNATHSVTPGRR
jgi:hypothetical protein